jgi:hypothetical protein
MTAFGQWCYDHDERLTRWHPAVRALVIMSGAAACWAAIGLTIF